MIFSTKIKQFLAFSLVSFFLFPAGGYAESNAIVALAEAPRQESRPGKLWKWSIAALLAGSAADAVTSWGRMEANPALRGPSGRFSTRGLLIKSSFVGGVLGAQMLFKKDQRSQRAMAWTNFALAGALGGVAAYNLNNRAPKSVPSYLLPH